VPWLLRDGEVLASLEIARSVPSRVRGLLGRDGIEGALLITKAKSVHTMGMRFPIDVAFVDRELRVVRMVTMRRWRLGRPTWKAHSVLEASAGAFELWQLHVGDVLAVKGDPEGLGE
jgi:hypothetical protein